MANALATEEIIDVEGFKFKVRSPHPERLHNATEWLHKRLLELSQQHPMLKPSDLHLLLLLELSVERLEFIENGKALLKETSGLVEWLGNQIG